MKRLLATALCLGLAGTAQAQLALETFDGGTFPPSGWTVADNTTAMNGAWNTTSFWGRSNSTGGWGEAACIDSDAAGFVDIDTELWTPAFTVPAAPAFLKIDTHYNDLLSGSDMADIDVSTDGGLTWTNLVNYDADVQTTVDVDLSAYAGQSVIVRFHYYDANYDWYWIVDNVYTGGANPTPTDCGFAPFWSEDFESGTFPPSGWSTTDNTTNGTLIWQTSSATSRGNLVGGNGESACYDADDYAGATGALDHDSYLISAPLTVPSTGTYNLEFNLNFQDFAGTGDFDFDITTDGGTTWTNLETWTDDTPTGGTSGSFIVVSYDFSSYAGQTVQLRWRYWGSDTSPSFFWFAQIDEVELWDSTLSVPDASATFRTDAGATNVDMLTVSGDPVLGSLFAIEVDVAASGLGFTQIFGYSGALSLNLGGTSRVVLIDLTHPGGEVLAASIASGPSAVYPYFLPTSCSLAGFNLSVQAAGFNIPNNAPWVLSNAQDLVLGF